LFANTDNTYNGEQAWNSGGGGLSQFEYSPYWESGVQPVSTTPAGLSFRGLPDIAMLSGLSAGAGLTGYTVYWTPANNGGFLGTSLASPLAVGSYARMMSAHNNTLGYAPPRLYAVYNQNPTAGAPAGTPPTELRGGFHDILTGVNGAYSALPGYDYTTGMGSFDIMLMNAAIGH
jgi:subtilase family serine protease